MREKHHGKSMAARAPVPGAGEAGHMASTARKQTESVLVRGPSSLQPLCCGLGLQPLFGGTELLSLVEGAFAFPPCLNHLKCLLGGSKSTTNGKSSLKSITSIYTEYYLIGFWNLSICAKNLQSGIPSKSPDTRFQVCTGGSPA